MKKVVYMITTLFYPSIGGVENHVYNLSRSFVDMDYVVKIINPVINLGTSEVYDLDGIQVHRISVGNKYDLNRYLKYKNKSNDCLMGYLYGYLRKYYYNRFWNTIYKYIINDIESEGNPKVIIHQHDFISSIKLSKKLSRDYSVIFTNHTGEFLFLKKLPFSDIIIKQLTKHFKYIIAPSDELAEFDGIRSSDTYEFMPNGVDINKFAPIDNEEKSILKQKYNLPEDKKIIFCPRRWAPTKGVIYLIRAIDFLVNGQSHKNLLFVFAGNDHNDYPEYVNEINKLISEKKLEAYIRLMGNIEYNSINEVMKISDVVVLPSLMEAVSLAALEAMACGKIVLGTEVGGFPQIIKHGENGFIVPPKDYMVLAEAIRAIFEIEEQHNIIGQNARKFIEDGYSWSHIGYMTSLIYDRYFT